MIEKYLSEFIRDSGNTFSRISFFRQESKHLHSAYSYIPHHPRFQLKMMKQILMAYHSLDRSPRRCPRLVLHLHISDNLQTNH